MHPAVLGRRVLHVCWSHWFAVLLTLSSSFLILCVAVLSFVENGVLKSVPVELGFFPSVLSVRQVLKNYVEGKIISLPLIIYVYK